MRLGSAWVCLWHESRVLPQAQVPREYVAPHPAPMHAMLVLKRLLLMALIAVLWKSPASRAADSFDHAHARYSRVLTNFVSNGRVDYAGLKAAPEELDGYLESIASVPPADFKQWSRDERLALLLNLYNAATLRLIADHYPVKSIRNIGLLPGAAWRKAVVRFGGEVISLDQLEHGIIRAEYAEPRIHFAVVCAAVSCPPLRREPYVGARLDQQLDEQTRAFLSDADKNRVDTATGVLWLSAIFEWYEQDFTRPTGSLENYVKPFLPPEVATALAGISKVQIRYLDYDWALNEWKR